MAPNTNASSVQGHEIVGDPGTPSETKRLMDFIPIYIPTVERGALSRSRRKRKRRFLDFLRAHPSKEWFLRSTFVGRRRQDQASSPPTDSDDGDGGGESGQPRRRFRVPFVRKIKWGKLWSYAVSWCRKPANLAMLVWLGFVAAGLLIVLMLMTGVLNRAIPKEELRKRWTEVVNQILNALFTIMCLYLSMATPIICTPKDGLITPASWILGGHDRLREYCVTVDASRGSGTSTWFRASSTATNRSSSTS